MSMHVRLCQLDGSLPNIALMTIAQWHAERGDTVHLFRGKRCLWRGQGEPEYGRVYGSTIFAFTKPLTDRFRAAWPEAIVGGTGTDSMMTVEGLLGSAPARLNYEPWPEFSASIGYTHRGCNLKCKWCVVPKREPGGARSTGSIADIWRGDPHPRQLHLLDNSFFAQPLWRERIAEIRDGGFKVSFSQGINIRSMTPETASALASVDYREASFKRKRVYCAWDNLADEEVFFRGVKTLEDAGIPPSHLMAYMLMGFDKAETFERIERRFWRMADLGIMPYPMVYDPPRNALAPKDLRRFQRWAILGRYHSCAFADFDETKRDRRRPRDERPDLFGEAA